MASGISNTFRVAGLATGVAALGAIFQQRVTTSLSSHAVNNAAAVSRIVSSAGVRAVAHANPTPLTQPTARSPRDYRPSSSSEPSPSPSAQPSRQSSSAPSLPPPTTRPRSRPRAPPHRTGPSSWPPVPALRARRRGHGKGLRPPGPPRPGTAPPPTTKVGVVWPSRRDGHKGASRGLSATDDRRGEDITTRPHEPCAGSTTPAGRRCSAMPEPPTPSPLHP